MSVSKAVASSVGLFVSTSLLLTLGNAVYGYDILDVYAQAEMNNIPVKSSQTDFRILQERRNEIASEYDPSLSLNVTPGYQFSDVENGNRTTVDYSFSLTKPIYQKQLNARLSQADSVVQRERVTLDFQKQQLIARVATAYINFVSAQNKLRFSVSEQGILRQNLGQINTLFNAQMVTLSDVSETQLLLEQSLYTSSVARLELDNARRALQLETGQSYYSLAELDESRQLPQLQPNQLREWIALANSFSHELQQARYDLHIQKKDIRVQQDSNSTSIDLFASYDGETGAKKVKQSSGGGKLGFELKIPLYSGDRNAAKVRSSKLQYQKTQYALDLKRQEISQNIQLAFLTVMSGFKNVRLLRNAVLTSQKTIDSNQRGRAAGVNTVSEVLSAQRESLAVKRSYTEARYKFLIDLVNLRLAAGVLSVDDLKTMSLLFSIGQNQGRNFNTQASSIERSFDEAESELMSLEDAWGLN